MSPVWFAAGVVLAAIASYFWAIHAYGRLERSAPLPDIEPSAAPGPTDMFPELRAEMLALIEDVGKDRRAREEREQGLAEGQQRLAERQQELQEKLVAIMSGAPARSGAGDSARGPAAAGTVPPAPALTPERDEEVLFFAREAKDYVLHDFEGQRAADAIHGIPLKPADARSLTDRVNKIRNQEPLYRKRLSLRHLLHMTADMPLSMVKRVGLLYVFFIGEVVARTRAAVRPLGLAAEAGSVTIVFVSPDKDLDPEVAASLIEELARDDGS